MAQPHSIPPSSVSSSQITDHYENPYYLHNSDHAGLKLVTDRLTSGADFHSWRRSVRMALNVRNKLGFIDGTIRKPPSTSRDSGSWSRCNDMVATWLMNSVSKNIGQSLLFMSTAESIWNNLMQRFKQDDAPRVFEIEQRLSALTQGSLDVSAYYTELITLWEEYKNYIELPVCTCGRCECNAALLWEQMQQRGRVTKFLMGLNDSYEQTRRHILMLKPIPTIEEAFNMVAQDERQKGIKPALKTDSVALQTTGPSSIPTSPVYMDPSEYIAAYNAYRPRGNRPLCTHCGQLGHTVAKCFKLHGYPPGYKPSPGYQGQSSQPRPSQGYAPRGQMAYPPRSSAPVKTVAQLAADAQPIAVAPSLDVNQLTSSQLQSIIQQLQTRVQVTDNVASCATHSITEQGVMAEQSSAGPYSGLDDWEG
ncbi:uncharacterized protein LOC130508462 [Raphanus sativus]|uniref:Uncharacterized protein LOC130508462 n=1 Tax=Raphanus sativus TaxID=3726 RepID=A0A9W3D880_RAPSA|nr:uncharacterized protein LOC130508462 [Raphanus sativus]